MFAKPAEVSRGLIHWDWEHDGDLDLLVSNAAGPARLYRNVAEKAGNWLIVRLIDPSAEQRCAPGTNLRLSAVNGRSVSRISNPYAGYLSNSTDEVHFGMADDFKAQQLEIEWPDGTREDIPVNAVNQRLTILRGTGDFPTRILSEDPDSSASSVDRRGFES